MPQDSAERPATDLEQEQIKYSPTRRLIYDPEQDDVVLNKHHLEIILLRIQQEKDKPTLNDAIPWIGLLLAFLLALIPNDFEDFASIDGSVWTALAFFFTVASALKVVAVFKEIYDRRDEPRKVAGDYVKEVMDEFKDRTAEVERQKLARVPDLGAGQEQGTIGSTPDTADSPPQPTS